MTTLSIVPLNLKYFYSGKWLLRDYHEVNIPGSLEVFKVHIKIPAGNMVSKFAMFWNRTFEFSVPSKLRLVIVKGFFDPLVPTEAYKSAFYNELDWFDRKKCQLKIQRVPDPEWEDY